MPVKDAFATVTEGSGGAVVSVVIAPTDTTDSKTAGVALANKTFSAFTDDDSRIDNYLAETITVTGTCSWSGTGLGPYTPTSADGDSGTLLLHARDSSNNILATATHSYSRAAASDGPTTLIDFSGCDDYDFLTTGGTSGSGGDGTHTLSDGTVCEMYTVGSGSTIYRIVSGKLETSSPDTSNYSAIYMDLGTGTEFATVFVRAVYTAQADCTNSGIAWKMSETTSTTANVADDLQFLFLGGTASNQDARYRFVNSAVSFNNYQTISGADLASGNSFRLTVDSGNLGAISGGENGATLPTWNNASMAAMAADVRNAIASFRRYLHLFGSARHVKLTLKVQYNR